MQLLLVSEWKVINFFFSFSFFLASLGVEPSSALPLVLFIFWNTVLLNCQAWPQTCNPLTSTSWITGITDVCHCSQPVNLIIFWITVSFFFYRLVSTETFFCGEGKCYGLNPVLFTLLGTHSATELYIPQSPVETFLITLQGNVSFFKKILWMKEYFAFVTHFIILYNLGRKLN